MNSFRTKILISYTLGLIVFLFLLFPVVSDSVQTILIHSMNKQADDLIHDLSTAKDEKDLIQIIKEQKRFLFYRVGIFDNKARVLYDTHTKYLLGPLFQQKQYQTHIEVQEALSSGYGYNEQYSHLLEQKLIYIARRFDFHSKPYVLRLAFSYENIETQKEMFRAGLLIFSSVILILFFGMTLLIFRHFTRPIREITQAITPYRKGSAIDIPEIKIQSGQEDEFSELAYTLNSLSDTIKEQISTLTIERNQREVILHSLAEGVIAIDSKGIISFANPCAKLWLNLEEDTLFPKNEYPLCHAILTQAEKTRKAVPAEMELSQKGIKQYFHILACPRQDTQGTILVLQDMTEHVKILEMRKAFIANASHELKTPITIIQGFAETLFEHQELDIQTKKDSLLTIIKSCKRMSNTIQNLLRLADIEHLKTLHLEKIDILEIIRYCQKNLLLRYPEAESILDCSQHTLYIYADHELLELAIQNILDNGAKYSKQKPHIKIRVLEKIDSVEIEIEDNGIGIAKEEQEHVFQRFWRAQKLKKEGSGLGLSITETVIERHKGQIFVKNSSDQGTTFCIIIPKNL